MKYQKIINLLENTPNYRSKFRTKNCMEVNDESCWIYNVNNQIKFKTLILKSRFCDYSDPYILLSTTMTVSNIAAARAAGNNRKNIITKNWAPVTNCISKKNNTKINNAKDIDIVMSTYNLIEYSNNYSKTCGKVMALLQWWTIFKCLWCYCWFFCW